MPARSVPAHVDGALASLPITGPGREPYLEGVDRRLSGRADAMERFRTASQRDPGLVQAHAALGLEWMDQGEPAAAAACFETAVATEGPDSDQARVLRGLSLDGTAAIPAALEWLGAHPTDALVWVEAIETARLHGGPSRAAWIEQLLDRAQPTGRWLHRAHLAAHLAESGRAEQAEAQAVAALSERPDCGTAMRAFCEATASRFGHGAAQVEAWLAREPTGPLHGHLSWHLALTDLRLGQVDQVQRRWQAHIRPSASLGSRALALADAAGLLGRIALLREPVPLGTQEIPALVRHLDHALGVPFVAVHALVATALSDPTLLPKLRERIELAAEARGTAGLLSPLALGLAAWGTDDRRGAHAWLTDLDDDILNDVGGTRTQRGLLSWIRETVDD